MSFWLDCVKEKFPTLSSASCEHVANLTSAIVGCYNQKIPIDIDIRLSKDAEATYIDLIKCLLSKDASLKIKGKGMVIPVELMQETYPIYYGLFFNPSKVEKEIQPVISHLMLPKKTTFITYPHITFYYGKDTRIWNEHYLGTGIVAVFTHLFVSFPHDRDKKLSMDERITTLAKCNRMIISAHGYLEKLPHDLKYRNENSVHMTFCRKEIKPQYSGEYYDILYKSKGDQEIDFERQLSPVNPLFSKIHYRYLKYQPEVAGFRYKLKLPLRLKGVYAPYY